MVIKYLELACVFISLAFIVVSDNFLERIRDRVIASYCYLSEKSLNHRVLLALSELSAFLKNRFGSAFGKQTYFFSIKFNTIVFAVLLIIFGGVLMKWHLAQPLQKDVLEKAINTFTGSLKKSIKEKSIKFDEKTKDILSVIENIDSDLNKLRDDDIERYSTISILLVLSILFIPSYGVSVMLTFLSLAITITIVNLSAKSKSLSIFLLLLVVDALVAAIITISSIILLILIAIFGGYIPIILILSDNPLLFIVFNLFYQLSIGEVFFSFHFFNSIFDLSALNSYPQELWGMLIVRQIESFESFPILTLLYSTFQELLYDYATTIKYIVTIDFHSFWNIDFVRTCFNWSITLSILPTIIHGFMMLSFALFPLLEPFRKFFESSLLYIENHSTHTGRMILGILSLILYAGINTAKLF